MHTYTVFSRGPASNWKACVCMGGADFMLAGSMMLAFQKVRLHLNQRTGPLSALIR